MHKGVIPFEPRIHLRCAVQGANGTEAYRKTNARRAQISRVGLCVFFARMNIYGNFKDSSRSENAEAWLFDKPEYFKVIGSC